MAWGQCYFKSANLFGSQWHMPCDLRMPQKEDFAPHARSTHFPSYLIGIFNRDWPNSLVPFLNFKSLDSLSPWIQKFSLSMMNYDYKCHMSLGSIYIQQTPRLEHHASLKILRIHTANTDIHFCSSSSLMLTCDTPRSGNPNCSSG